MQRSIHAGNLYTVKPHPGERISNYCERLLQYCDPVDGTDEAISDSVLLQHLFNNAGPIFTQTTHNLRKKKSTISVQDAIDELCEFERNHLANNQIGDPGNNTARTLLYSYGGKTPVCKYCKKKGYHINDCRKKQNAQKTSGKFQDGHSGKFQDGHSGKFQDGHSGKFQDGQQTSGRKHSRDDIECWHCWQTGHTEKNCLLKKSTEEFKARRNQKQFGSKGRAMAADVEEDVLRSNLD